METAVVSGVAYTKNEAKITIVKVPDRPGGAANIVVDVIVQNVSVTGFTDLTFTVGRGDYKKAMMITEETAKEIKAERVVGDDKIAKVSIVGMAMRSHSGVATKVFETLASEGINILGITTSESHLRGLGHSPGRRRQPSRLHLLREHRRQANA